jgi:hypothetical protein
MAAKIINFTQNMSFVIVESGIKYQELIQLGITSYNS